ncbi:signal peptidase I [Endozoicomonas sp. (ex Bugula neritina AB1)]|nr:signal peptidase I [Endozoicomonas sp. (ex Bugula neritina AB1)]
MMLLVFMAVFFSRFSIALDPQTYRCLKQRVFLIDHGDKNIGIDDLVAFIHKKGAPLVPPGSQMIKAVRAMSGDNVIVSQESVVVNGRVIEQSMDYGLKTLSATREDYSRTLIVPDQEFFLMGTTIYSNDSRFWGSIPESDVVGKVYALF